jgi:Sigma-70, region 4
MCLVPDVTSLANGWDPWPAVDARVDTQAVLRTALAKLRPQEREVLTLVACEDLTVADAARVLGMPAGTARRLLHQARMALRNAPEVAALLTDLKPARVPEMVPVRGRGFSRARNRRRGALGTRGKVGVGVGIGAAAAAVVAIVLAVTSTPPPAAPAGSVPHALAATSKLVTLAALIGASDGSLPGNASLVISTQVNGGKLMQVVYALYTDSGNLYLGDDKKSLMTAVADHANLADGTNAREIAAARYAAVGDLATARVQMVDALPNDFFLTLAARKKIWAAGAAARQALMREKGIKTPLEMPTGQALQNDINNYLWTASTIALSWGAGDPEIREGVLRLLSTIPEVAVANSTTGGQPTLTITAGPALFGGGSDQVLTVNARTGIPISSVESGGGLPTAVETDQVSRVTLADIEAGEF